MPEHYFDQTDVRSILDDADLRNYGWLIRRDRLMRAINLFILDKPSEAALLLHDVYSFDAIEAAIKTSRGRHCIFCRSICEDADISGFESIRKKIFTAI